jgi:acid phosphatase type 7
MWFVMVTLLSGLPARAQQEPFVVHETRPKILYGPYLVAPTETSVTVAWTTDVPCHSKVLYGSGGDLSREAENQVHGMVPIGLHHAVRLGGLEPGRTYSYRAVSTGVVKMKSYWPEKSLPVESPVYSCTTFDRRKPSVSFSLIADTHGNTARIEALMKQVDWSATDFLAHLGDTVEGVESTGALLSKVVDPISQALAHRKPLLLARGNHDTRGPGARSLIDIVPIPEGRFYYTRDAGPVHFIVLDTGEDKDDNTNVYARLNRFKAYREEEFAWFRQQAAQPSAAPFRVLLMHAPNWGWVDGQAEKWTALANQAGIDLAICGHTLRYAHGEPGQKGRNYHELVIGSENVARVDASATDLKVAVVNREGGKVTSFAIPRRR